MKIRCERKRILGCVVAAGILLTTLGACAAKNGVTRTDSYDMSPAESMAGGMYAVNDSADFVYESESYSKKADGGQYGLSGSSDSSANEIQPQDGTRKLIKTVSMDMETKEFDAFLSELYGRIEAAGGYIQSSSVNGGRYGRYEQYERSAFVTARIPAEKLDYFCDGVSATANVVSRREDTSDVTLTYYDTESRMKALESEYETLVGILEKCTKLEDVISVQSRITEVLYQIESHRSTLNRYDSQVAYSTVTMNISEVKVETIVTEQTMGERIATGISQSFREISEGCEDLLVGVTVSLPYLIIWGVIIAVCVLTVRGAVRRTRRKRLARNQQPIEPKE